jgi:GNAT superfamily N-acetyltransferase
MNTPNRPDDLLAALRAARPEPDHQPSPASAEAVGLLTRILDQPHARERAHRARPARRLILAGIPAVAAAAVVGGLEVTARSSGSPGGVPDGTSLRAAILDAFDQASGEILATVRFINVSGGMRFTERTWTYPMFPRPGQRVRSRVTESSAGGRPAMDEESVYLQPRPASTAPVPGTVLIVDYPNRKWDRGTLASVITIGGPSPAQIRGDIANGTFRVIGTERLDGRPAVKLTLTADKPALTKTLWVDARTYMPLQVAFTVINGAAITSNIVKFQVLPATPENLGLLVPPIPAGFTLAAKACLACHRFVPASTITPAVRLAGHPGRPETGARPVRCESGSGEDDEGNNAHRRAGCLSSAAGPDRGLVDGTSCDLRGVARHGRALPGGRRRIRLVCSGQRPETSLHRPRRAHQRHPLVVIEAVTGPPPRGWVVEFAEHAEMLYATKATLRDAEVTTVRPGFDIVDLTRADADEMIALSARAGMGYVQRHVVDLGPHIGIRRDGQLVAMGGERFHTPGWAELSVARTDPAYRGQGFYRRILNAQVARIVNRGEQPFTHTENPTVIKACGRLGFRMGREVTANFVRYVGAVTTI